MGLAATVIAYTIVNERVLHDFFSSQPFQVIEEREKLKAEQEARQKKLHYLRTELERLSKQQGTTFSNVKFPFPRDVPWEVMMHIS